MKKVIDVIINENSVNHKKYFKHTEKFRALVEYDDRSIKMYYFNKESELPQDIQKFIHEIAE